MSNTNTNTNTNNSNVEPRVEKSTSLSASSKGRGPLSNITNAKKNSNAADLGKLSTQFEKDCKISKKAKIEDGAEEGGSERIPHEDIDRNDFNDPQAVAEYVNPIYEYLMIREKDRVDYTYMMNQKHITEKNACDFS